MIKKGSFAMLRSSTFHTMKLLLFRRFRGFIGGKFAYSMKHLPAIVCASL